MSQRLPTIFALSTNPGRAAIAVVRILGTQSKYIYSKLTNTTKPPVPRTASVRKIYGSNGLLDQSLTLFLNGPNTYTGEDLLELHLHGGTAIVKTVLDAVKKFHSPEKGIFIRYAENGEFSRRAFMNGRLDLTEVEGIRELIDAETETQRLSALASASGDTKRLFQKWRTDVVHNVALLTTLIDFGEEHDLEETAQLLETVATNVDQLKSEIISHLEKVKGSEILLKGIKVSLIGPPNAGKLSLLNVLANSEMAIVSNIPGTTRDVIDVPLDIAGYKVVVGDTAGIRNSDDADQIEREGIKRAKQRAFFGDVVLAVLPATEPISAEILHQIEKLQSANRPILLVLNKIDLLELSTDEIIENFSKRLNIPATSIYPVSCISEEGIPQLLERMVAQFKHLSMSVDSDPIVVSSRIQDLLQNDVIYGLEQFKLWKDADDVVLASECLRQSVEGIGKITGEAIGLEEVLGVVFSSFCIGK